MNYIFYHAFRGLSLKWKYHHCADLIELNSLFSNPLVQYRFNMKDQGWNVLRGDEPL